MSMAKPATKPAAIPGYTGKKNRVWIAWVLVAPALLIRTFTTLYPFLMTFYNSLFNLSIFKGNKKTFIGLDNFINMWTDDKFLRSLEFTFLFAAVSIALHLVLGMILALMLNQKFRAKKLLRTITLIPWAMPMVVVGIAARWAFNGTYGLMNDVIRWFVPGFQFDWLVYKDTARMAVIAVDLWKDIPFFAILVLAGLQFIPGDVYESASIDGAGPVRSFFLITLPLIKRNLLTLLIFFSMWRLTSFDVVYSMTAGGPAEGTSLLAYRISMEAFSHLNLGYASSIAVVLFIMMALLSMVNLFFIKKIDY
ncbi:sugar ABC transporter permease [Eubacteriales bacterium OttesenSCG-928-N13]|nr:sugar ABC transporter permease [Eubacteriales bacterium OttesenSCG-928-N13]